MSFSESMFVGGFNQKTVKVDPIVRLNRNYPRRKQLQKTLEDSRRQTTKAEGMWLLGGADRPHLQAVRLAYGPHLSAPPSNDGCPPP